MSRSTQSLDGPADADAASEWDAEIVRRFDQVTSGNAGIIDRADFARRMRERLQHGNTADGRQPAV